LSGGGKAMKQGALNFSQRSHGTISIADISADNGSRNVLRLPPRGAPLLCETKGNQS
jgi:hypothetical protein